MSSKNENDPSELFKLLDHIFKGPKTKTVHLDFMTEDEIKEWNSLKAETKELVSREMRLKTRGIAFWSAMKLRLNNYDGQLVINETTTGIEKEVDDDD